MTVYQINDRPLHSADDITTASRRAGSHFFEADTMRAFGSRILSDVYPAAGGGRSYFVTSERDRPWAYGPGAWEGQRRYTVRVIAWASPGTIDEPAGCTFGEYRSRVGALSAARRFAAADTAGALAWPCPMDTHAKYSRPWTPHPDTGPELCEACAEAVAHIIRQGEPLEPDTMRRAARLMRPDLLDCPGCGAEGTTGAHWAGCPERDR